MGTVSTACKTFQAALKRVWASGSTYAEMTSFFGVTRDQVIRLRDTLKLPLRLDRSKRKKGPRHRDPTPAEIAAAASTLPIVLAPNMSVGVNVMLRLLDGPLSTTALHGFLHSIEPLLTPALEQDPYVAAVIGPSVSEHFNGLRAWIAQRDVAVREQVAANLPAPRAPYPGGRDTTAPAVSSLRLSPTTAGPGGTVAVTASVADEGGVVSADAQAGTLGWMPMQATSGAFGDATLSVSGTVIAPADTGSHPVCVRASDVAGNVNVPVCVTLIVDARVPTTLAYTGPSAVRTGAIVTLTAQLTAPAAAVVGRTVTFVFNKLTYSAPTAANGVASVTVKAPTKTGTYPVALQFAGDDAHLPSSSSASVAVTR